MPVTVFLLPADVIAANEEGNGNMRGVGETRLGSRIAVVLVQAGSYSSN